MNARRWYLRGLSFAGLLLLLTAGGQHAGLVARRGADDLQWIPPEDTTPLVAVTTVAFGAFRGLVADALWMRAAELQEEGQHFELVQLATWISHLAPTMPEVWEFQAWNLAYNISVLFADDSDRWRWVVHGLDLLRVDGLRHNPTAPSLFWNIGWIFQHKIGMDFDQSHLYYKTRLAREAQEIFADENWRSLVRDRLRMDPDGIEQLEGRFGPIDWQLPSAHTLYWSSRGLRHLRRDAFNARRLQRMRLQTLADLFRRGQLLTDADGAPVIALPRFDLLPILLEDFAGLLPDARFSDLATSARRSLLAEAALLLAAHLRTDEALDAWQQLAELDPDVSPNPEAFQEFLAASFLHQDPARLSREQMLLRLGATLSLAREWDGIDEARARGLRTIARQDHRRYQITRLSPEHVERTGLPPFEAIDLAIRSHQLPGEIL